MDLDQIYILAIEMAFSVFGIAGFFIYFVDLDLTKYLYAE